MAVSPGDINGTIALVYPGSGDFIYGLFNTLNSDFFSYSISANTWNSALSQAYLSPGTISNLKINSGDGVRSRWSTISWQGVTPTNTSITFRTRGANTEAGLTTATWSQPYTTSGSAITTPSSQWLEIELRLTSTDGINTPTLNDFTVTYDTLEAPQNQNIILAKTDGTNLRESNGNIVVGGATGGWSNSSVLRVSASELTCTDCATPGTNIRPEVEAKPIGTPFNGQGTFAAISGNTFVDITGLTAGGYHLRVRAIDDQGRVSGWVSYGGNADGQADFLVDQTIPQGTISINNDAVSTREGAVTLNITADDANSRLGRLYLSNDGTNWENRTPQMGFVGQASYSGNISWNLAPGGDGTRNVYLRVVDNAGSTNGHIIDTDFSGGTQDITLVEGGSVRLDGVTAQIVSDAQDGTYTIGWFPNEDRVDVTSGSMFYGSYQEPWMLSSTYIKFFNIPNKPVGKASIRLNFESFKPLIIDHISDYGAMRQGMTYTTYSSGFLHRVEGSSGWNTFDVTSQVNADIASGRTVSAFKIWRPQSTESHDRGSIFTSESVTKPTLELRNSPPPYNSTGSFSSRIFDTGSAGHIFGRFSAVGTTEQNITNISYRVRAGNQPNLSDAPSWDVAPTINSGDTIPQALQGKRYIQYRAVLTTNNNTKTPVLEDVFIDVFSRGSDQITLDTQPPGNFSLVSPENNVWSTTEPNPVFTWTASGGHDKYQLFINGVLNVDNIPPNTTSITASAPLSEGRHTWVVRALDLAGNVTEATGGARVYGYDFSRPTRVSGFSAPMAGATVSSILVRWNPANDAISGISGYVLERKRYDDFWGGPTFATFNLGVVTSFTDTGLESGFRYNYRIRAFDVAGLFSHEYTFTEGVTIDTTPPSVPTNVTASVTSQGENSGREIVLNWNPSFDTGTGVSKYKVWRRAETNDTRDVNDLGQEVANNANQIWTLVGVVQNTGALLGTWADNDANNDRIMDDKTSPSPRLNDFVDYFYRVVAVDVAGNHSTLITRDPVLRLPDNTNLASGRTVDITAPSIPVNITVTPTGVDTLGGEPLTQAAEITWGPSFDTRTLGRVPTGSGSGVRDYRLYMARGNVSGPTEDFSFVRAVEGTSYTKEGLGEDTFYYFRVRAIDNSDNQSAQSVFGGALTRNSQVPTTPTNVTVRSKKGDPANDNEVGRRIDISFRGSRIKGTGNRVDGYRIYRSTTNFPSQSQWLALTPIHTFSNLGIPTETQDGERTFTDTVDSDSTRYFYRVQAFGWNESNQSTEVSPSLSSIQVDVLNAGWDITPDITAPAQPQEVKVKDIHGNESLFRNIITWTRVTDSLRNEVFDFSHYEVWRYETLLGVISAVKVSNDSNYTDPGFNYFVDGIPRTEVDKDFSYFVIARDNASTEFRYANGVVINPFSNSSGFSGVASINPSAASPTVMDIQHRDIGVSAATIEWRTNQLSDSLVEFRVRGTDTVIAAGRNRTTPVTHHIVNLVGLREGTDYEYRIISRNSLGNIDTTAATEWRHFRTSEFRITDVSVETTTTTATVRWRTNIPADSNVEYKEETVFDMVQESQTAGNPNLSRDHEVVIRSLRPNTNYTYKIRSVSGDRFIVETAFASFRTRPFDASQFIITPSASNIAEQQITATSARIVWQTLIPTTTWVDYGTASGVYSQSAGTNDFNTTHVVELKNLTPGQTYFYRVRGVDANNIEYTSREYSFTAVLEPQISDIRVNLIDSFNAIISFNTNVDTEASVTYGADGRLDLKAGTTEFKRNHVINIENLEDGKTYGYFIEVRDRLNNAKRSESAVFETPIDRTGAKIENLKIDILPMSEADATASVIISWRSNKPTTTLVKYDEGAIVRELRKSTVEDKSFNTSHTVVIRDLNPSTTYQFRISGVDRRGNITESQNYNFVTPSQERSILQLIIRSLEETFAWTRNLGDFTRNIRERF